MTIYSGFNITFISLCVHMSGIGLFINRLTFIDCIFQLESILNM